MTKSESKDAGTVSSLATAAVDGAKSAVDAGIDAFNAVSKKARHVGQSTDDYVRDNPWIALGAAAGVGILIGLLCRGRRSD